ncbi:MAG: flavocytochrome c [Spirochaetales bacterium]
MKKILTIVLSTAMILSLIACGGGKSVTGTAKGFGGDLTVSVTFDGETIKSVDVKEHNETAGIGTIPLDSMPSQIVANQSVNLDIIAGATVTSIALLEATTNAIEKAGFNPANYNRLVQANLGDLKSETLDVDIVVIGAGGAGLISAIEATLLGKSVVVVEKMAFAGGNSIKATGGMNAAETSIQAAAGIQDSAELFFTDTYEGGYEVANPDLVRIMAEESADAVEWLATVGAPLAQVSFSGGASVSRIHQPQGGAAIGAYLIKNFVAKVEELGVDIRYNTTATKILTDSGKAVGIMANSADTEYTINADAVIIASGGFGANESLYAMYREDLTGFVTTNHSGATGDGLVMAEAVGAALVDVGEIQIHPTVHQGTSIMITESVRGDGAILVNQAGERFTNEMGTRDVVSAAEIAQDGGYAYVIFDQRLREALAASESYISNGLTVQADTIADLAIALNIDSATLENTLATWNAAVASKNDSQFGRTTAMEYPLATAPFYAIQIAPGVHHTMGGVKINTETEVLTANGTVIPGLYAAGEVTGGIHGGNRIGGNAVSDFVVFGRIAGKNAAEYVSQ